MSVVGSHRRLPTSAALHGVRPPMWPGEISISSLDLHVAARTIHGLTLGTVAGRGVGSDVATPMQMGS